MRKYRVSGPANVEVSIIVEAESEEDAMEIACKEFLGVRGYCGNGSISGKLIGVSGQNERIEFGDFEFHDVEEIV